MTTKPTPGPLEVSIRPSGIAIHRSEAACIADAVQADPTPGKRAVYVQAIAWMADTSEESLANARRLVRAANCHADLLRCLKAFVDSWSIGGPDWQGKLNYDTFTDARKAIQRAESAANGETTP